MANIKIAILNQSSVVTDAEAAAAVHTLQKQISADFAPIWGATADLTLIAPGLAAAPGSWQLVILDDSDETDTIGCHGLAPGGLPVMKVFAKTAREDGVSWTSAASHEILEAMADPFVDSTVFVQTDDSGGRLWPLEVCDPVEGDVYEIDGEEVSNFVTPQWFMAKASAGAVFDFLGLVTKPFEVRPTGYMEYYDVTGGKGWKQL